MRREGYFTRSFCPTWSEFELTPGFSCSISAIGTPVFAEIEPNVSPLCDRVEAAGEGRRRVAFVVVPGGGVAGRGRVRHRAALVVVVGRAAAGGRSGSGARRS